VTVRERIVKRKMMSILGSTAHHAMHEALSAMRFHAEDKRVSRALKKRSDAKAASINRCILATCCTSWALVSVKERKVRSARV
jgi:hypothetical protein